MKIIIPTSWDDITLEQYTRLMAIKLDTKALNTLLTVVKHKELDIKLVGLAAIGEDLDKLISFLSILLNVTEDDINSFDTNSLYDIIELLDWVKPIKDIESFESAFNEFDCGQWINCEKCIDAGLEENLVWLGMSIFKEDVSKLPITYVYDTIIKFLEYRRDLFSKFPNLFPKDNDSDRIKSKEELQKEKFYKVYTWEIFLLNLAGGDPLRKEEAKRMNFVDALNHFNMKHNEKLLVPLQEQY